MKKWISLLLACLMMLSAAPAVAMEAYTLECELNGEKKVFYLESAELVSKKQVIEARYAAYNPRGDKAYQIILAFYADHGVGTYGSDGRISCWLYDVMEGKITQAYDGLFTRVSTSSQTYSPFGTSSAYWDYSKGSPTFSYGAVSSSDTVKMTYTISKTSYGKMVMEITNRNDDWTEYRGSFAAGLCYGADKAYANRLEDAHFHFVLGKHHPRVEGVVKEEDDDIVLPGDSDDEIVLPSERDDEIILPPSMP